MKLKVSKKYFTRLRKVLKSKLNGENLVQGVNTLAVSLLRYSAAFISWRKCELQAIDSYIYTAPKEHSENVSDKRKLD